MKHFQYLSKEEKEDIFFKLPTSFNAFTKKDDLAIALGATMYSPGTDERIAETIISRKYKSLTCNVWCLEDAISDDDVDKAVVNIFKQANLIEDAFFKEKVSRDNIPLIFIRVRSVEQLDYLLENSSHFMLKLITGFNLPKFESSNGEAYLSLISKANKAKNLNLYAMPILESDKVIYIETRNTELIKVKEIINKYEDIVLNIRLGGTDFSSLYGLRRGVDFTIYDVKVISHCMSDIMNVFGRAKDNYAISGVVWEYFPDNKRILKPQLRRSLFEDNNEEQRSEIISKEIDGLIKELILDKANGFSGKTIIHPTHIKYVNALQTVNYEEYMDALSVLGTKDKGVVKSSNGNKMNEVKPHTNWAIKVLRKANIYGVLKEDKTYVDLF